ncbi:MAG TPA: type II toxin-antitoxin system VapC family toxin [Candidatus Contendobacter sp.]|nr:type II toxin-antitoxin system VapC family toxin [Candidatus Contendobacter sp.]HRD50068.1 type II toxin-antitoxin system VapC family toxin [Candidatus Contendobacter sp.]
MKNIQSHDALAISVVTQLELMIGCRNKSELRKLDKFIKQIQIIKLNENISDKSVELLRLYRLSHGLLIADGLIAATALTLNLPFISKNQRDYKFISGLNLLPYP